MIVTHILVLNASATSPEFSVEDSGEWKTLLESTSEQTKRTVYIGRQEEDSNKLWMISDWPALDSWSSNLRIQQALGSLISTGLATPSWSFHVALQSEDRKALDAPTTEISIGYVQAGSDAAIRLEQAVLIFASKAAASGIPGWAAATVSSWTYEKDLEFIDLKGRMSKGRGFFTLLGWESKKAHETFPAAEVGSQDIGAAGAEGWSISHVKFHGIGR